MSGLVSRALNAIVSRRARLPRFVNRLIDDVAKNPDGVLARVADVALGGTRSGSIPDPTACPQTDTRVYIGPTNYAGQGKLWASALQAQLTGVGARNMAVALPGGFAFDADTTVPLAVYNSSSRWQTSQLAVVKQFTHVLIEAERPLFGRLFARDVAREVAALSAAGLSVALICHGTDIRSPRAHLASNPWSPYSDDKLQTATLQRDADKNLDLITSLGLPVFVSTPDLLVDVPFATWCPVVVDPARWNTSAPLLGSSVPVVSHMPSMGAVKGTFLIEPAMRRLHDEGLIEYRSVSGVAAHDMPRLVAQTDILLDQFRLGSYGVAACEAMAAGRAVVGHIPRGVRDLVRERSGLDLPIIEATPESLEVVVRALADNKQLIRDAGAAGPQFVHTLHSGSESARVLGDGWIFSGL